VRGLTLVNQDGLKRADGFALLAAAREAALQERFTMLAAAYVDSLLAEEKARAGDLDDAIELSRAALDEGSASGDVIGRGPATAALVEVLLRRGGDADLQEAQAARPARRGAHRTRIRSSRRLAASAAGAAGAGAR
jgi:adenylate cyclase